MEKNYKGFYTSRPFWAGGKPSFSILESPVHYTWISEDKLSFSILNRSEHFSKIMEEDIFKYESELYQLKICKDGMILFRNEELEQDVKNEYKKCEGKQIDIKQHVNWWSTYLDYLNCIYLLLESATLSIKRHAWFEISEITNKDVFQISFKDGKFSGCTVPELSIVSKFITGRNLSDYDSDFSRALKFDQRLSWRLEIQNDVFELLNDNFGKIFPHYDHIRTLSNLLKSLAEYKIGNYSVSFILAWFIIESHFSQSWRSFLNDKNCEIEAGEKRINRKRMDIFKGRDYTISVILSMLELSDKISITDYNQVEKLRKIRNAIVHENAECSNDACINAFEFIRSLIKNAMGLDLMLSTGYSISGLLEPQD
jgi:hypothetical protein